LSERAASVLDLFQFLNHMLHLCKGRRLLQPRDFFRRNQHLD
jgi:hypothetical protein